MYKSWGDLVRASGLPLFPLPMRFEQHLPIALEERPNLLDVARIAADRHMANFVESGISR